MIDAGSLAVEWLTVGALVALLGALIRFAGWTFLLAGYDRSASIPDEVVASVAGNTILRVGLATVGFGVVASYLDLPSYLALVFEAIVVLAVVRLVYRLNTYDSAEPA